MLPSRPLQSSLESCWFKIKPSRLQLICIFAVSVGCIALCYLFVDRAFSRFVFDNELSRFSVLKWLTYPPPVIQTWSPLLLVIWVLRLMSGKPRQWETILAFCCISMILADQFRESISYIFGRYWPETWIDNNPSFIRDGAYGFHWLTTSHIYGSFPSGHAARIAAPAVIICLVYPRWSWLAILTMFVTAFGLLGMNYHFASDVLAGTLLGGLVGYFSLECLEILSPPHM